MSLQLRSPTLPALAGGSIHQRAALLLGVQNQLVTGAAQTSTTIKRIICSRGKFLPPNMAKDRSEMNKDDCRSRSRREEKGIFHPSIIHMTLLLFALHPFLFYHLCLAPQLLSNRKQSLQSTVRLGLVEAVSSHIKCERAQTPFHSDTSQTTFFPSHTHPPDEV